MQFLNPMYLWGLIGLTIPIIIHLWSRKEGKIIKVGSIQLLQPSETKKASAVKINEILLLILRVSIIALISLGMSEPLLKEKGSVSKLTYVIEPELLHNKNIQRFINEVPPGNELRYFLTDFPEINENEDILDSGLEDHTKYWQLAKELTQLETDSIIILTRAKISGFKGRRPELPGYISWVKIDDLETIEQNVSIVKNNDNYQVFRITSDQTQYSMDRKTISEVDFQRFENDSVQYKDQKLPLFEAEELKVVVHTSDSLAKQFDYIKASLNAISEYTGHKIEIIKYDPAIELHKKNCDLLIWMDTQKVNYSDILKLQYRQDDLAWNSIEQSADRESFYLTHLLSKENIIESSFISQLIELINPYEVLNQISDEYDRRALHVEQIKTESLSVKDKNIQEASLNNVSKWIWILLLVVVIIERIIAKARKQ